MSLATASTARSYRAGSAHIRQLNADAARQRFVERLKAASTLDLTGLELRYLDLFFSTQPSPAGWTEIQRACVDALRLKYENILP